MGIGILRWQWGKAFKDLSDGRQQHNGRWVFDGCDDGMLQGGGTGTVARVAMATVTTVAMTVKTATAAAAMARKQ